MYMKNPGSIRWLACISLLLLLIAVFLTHIGDYNLRVTAILGMPLLFYLLLLPGAGIFAAAEKVSWTRVLVRPANLVTLIRPAVLLAGTSLGALILVKGNPGATGSIWAWAASVLIGAGFSADFLDGFLARRETADEIHNFGKLGSWLDAESDAIAIALSGLSLVLIREEYLILLLPIFARHSFSLVFVLFPVQPLFPRWFRRGSKTIAAILQFTLASIWISELIPLPRFAPFAEGLIIASTFLIIISFFIETGFRIQKIADLLPHGHRKGLLKSVFVYYTFPFLIAPFRFVRMRRLYGGLVPKGGMVFDVGSHIGNRIPVFRSLGASVHAFEPQPSCRGLLEHWYGGEAGVQLHFFAMGKEQGTAPLYISREFPTLTSLDGTWVQNRTKDSLFKGVGWEKTGDIHISTLEHMIGQYGVPNFIKIDVEGHELQVLQGLDCAVPALSFEFLVSERAAGLECLHLLNNTGEYEFNFSPGESMRMVFRNWTDFRAMEKYLENTEKTISGDVYARKIS